MTTHLLFNLQIVHNWSKFAKDLVRLLMILQLRSNQIGKIPKWFWRIKNLSAILASRRSSSGLHPYILHDTNSLLGLADKLILCLLNLGFCLFRCSRLIMSTWR